MSCDFLYDEHTKCKYTESGNCEDCSLPVNEECPYVDDDD